MIHQLLYSIAMVSSRIWFVGAVVLLCAAIAGPALLSETNSSTQTAANDHTRHNGPPNLAMAHLDLGIIYSGKGQQSDALRELKLAAKINPEDVAVHWRLAQLYRAMGRKTEAEAEFEKTKTLTKAADESVSSKLHGDNAHAKESSAPSEPAKD